MEKHNEIECCNCGLLFGVSPNYLENLKKSKKLFYCPNGHGQSFSKSTAEYLKEQLAAAEEKVATLTLANRSLEGDLSRAKRKAKKK